MLQLLRIIDLFLCQVGVNLLKSKNIIYMPLFFINFFKYKYISKDIKIDNIFPILGEHKEKSIAIIKHYFKQDLLVASYIYKNNPKKHGDVGSRIDGFGALIATFKKK
jgi:hypothetical protein